MNVSDAEKRAIFKELLGDVKPRTRRDYPEPNITIKEYMAMEGVSTQTARRALETAVTKGILEKAVNVNIDDHPCNLYYKPSHENPET